MEGVTSFSLSKGEFNSSKYYTIRYFTSPMFSPEMAYSMIICVVKNWPVSHSQSVNPDGDPPPLMQDFYHPLPSFQIYDFFI